MKKLIIITSLIFCLQSLQSQESTNKNYNWQVVGGVNYISPVSFGVGLIHSKRFVTSIQAGTYFSLFKRYGGEVGLHNYIYLKKGSDIANRGGWYCYQSIFYNRYIYLPDGVDYKPGYYDPLSYIEEKYIGANLGIGRSFSFSPRLGLNVHAGILFRHSLYYKSEGLSSLKTINPFPLFGLMFFYKI